MHRFGAARTIFSAAVCERPFTVDQPSRTASLSIRARSLERAVAIALIDVDGKHLDTMSSSVGHQLRRSVETHRLAVQESGQENGRIMAFDPGRDIDQQGERCRMRFREAIGAEALDLAEEVAGEFLGVAVGQQTVDQFLPEPFDDAVSLPRGHGSAQLVGFARCEARRDDHQLHRLLLKQGYAKGLAQHVFHGFAGIFDRLLSLFRRRR